MTASGVSYVPRGTRTVYTGSVTTLAGQEVIALVSAGADHRLRLDFRLSIDAQAGTVSGTVARSTGGGAMSSTAIRSAALTEPPTGTRRLLSGLRADGRPTGLHEHHARYGPLPGSVDLIELADASGLRGRGGGGFPTAAKLRAVAQQRGRPIVVVNGGRR